MSLKDLIRPLPGARKFSLLRQRITFLGSMQYWEKNYARGGTSGGGSYGALAQSKADFLNSFVEAHNIRTVIEFGCGDGHQLSLAIYPMYIGLDVSRTAIDMCKRQFTNEPTKSFFLYSGDCFVDHAGLFTADLAISLDVVYHLTEDWIFERYMSHIFRAARDYVIVYSTNMTMQDTAPHVRHRTFSKWVDDNCPQWKLVKVAPGTDSTSTRADFFVYERINYDDHG